MFLGDLDARGLKQPEFVIVDGAPGLEAALVALWGEALPIQRCTVHKHRNLLGHAPKHMHGELSEDYRDMIYADTAAEIEKRRKAFLRKWHLRCRAVAPFGRLLRNRLSGSVQHGGGRGPAVHLHAPRPVAVEVRTNHKRHRAPEQGMVVSRSWWKFEGGVISG